MPKDPVRPAILPLAEVEEIFSVGEAGRLGRSECRRLAMDWSGVGFHAAAAEGDILGTAWWGTPLKLIGAGMSDLSGMF